MSEALDAYGSIVGKDVIGQLRQLAGPLRGMKVVHVNSTRVGGGVAEILHKLIPFMNELGIEASWEVISGNADFYTCTKHFHNALQGNAIKIPDRLLRAYEDNNRNNAEQLETLRDADVVFIHDPQPLPQIGHFGNRKGKWIWRCHIDASRPFRPVWKYLSAYAKQYDASIFSLPAFAQPLPHDEYIIPPSIDPLSEKNVDLDQSEIDAVRNEFGIDPKRPLITQVSRFDRFKDPVGVLQAYRATKDFYPGLQVALAGGTADDDPEGAAVLDEVRTVAEDDPDIHILLLPPDAHRTINALQRMSDVILQKSIKEGFGLTVTEGLWKGRPVIGGNTGGIRLQLINHHTGFLVDTPEGAALRIRYLLHRRERMETMGQKGREFVRENFLLTRQLRDYMAVMVGLTQETAERIRLG